jgi:hypothetical protein
VSVTSQPAARRRGRRPGLTHRRQRAIQDRAPASTPPLRRRPKPVRASTPKDLPGLALWLDGAQGTTFDGSAKLTSWVDQSGNANNATIVAPCVGPARAASSLNGHDTLAFSGSAGVGACLTIADAASLQFGTTDFGIFLVTRYTNVPAISGTSTTQSAVFWKKYLPGAPPQQLFTGVIMYGNDTSKANLQVLQTNLSGNQVASTTASLNDNNFRRLGATRRALDLEVWINGASDAKVVLATTTNVSEPAQPLYIGGNGAGAGGWLLGNIAEVVAVKGTLTNAQIVQLDAYLKAKYGL